MSAAKTARSCALRVDLVKCLESISDHQPMVCFLRELLVEANVLFFMHLESLLESHNVSFYSGKKGVESTYSGKDMTETDYMYTMEKHDKYKEERNFIESFETQKNGVFTEKKLPYEMMDMGNNGKSSLEEDLHTHIKRHQQNFLKNADIEENSKSNIVNNSIPNNNNIINNHFKITSNENEMSNISNNNQFNNVFDKKSLNQYMKTDNLFNDNGYFIKYNEQQNNMIRNNTTNDNNMNKNNSLKMQNNNDDDNTKNSSKFNLHDQHIDENNNSINSSNMQNYKEKQKNDFTNTDIKNNTIQNMHNNNESLNYDVHNDIINDSNEKQNDNNIYNIFNQQNVDNNNNDDYDEEEDIETFKYANKNNVILNHHQQQNKQLHNFYHSTQTTSKFTISHHTFSTQTTIPSFNSNSFSKNINDNDANADEAINEEDNDKFSIKNNSKNNLFTNSLSLNNNEIDSKSVKSNNSSINSVKTSNKDIHQMQNFKTASTPSLTNSHAHQNTAKISQQSNAFKLMNDNSSLPKASSKLTNSQQMYMNSNNNNNNNNNNSQQHSKPQTYTQLQQQQKEQLYPQNEDTDNQQTTTSSSTVHTMMDTSISTSPIPQFVIPRFNRSLIDNNNNSDLHQQKSSNSNTTYTQSQNNNNTQKNIQQSSHQAIKKIMNKNHLNNTPTQSINQSKKRLFSLNDQSFKAKRQNLHQSHHLNHPKHGLTNNNSGKGKSPPNETFFTPRANILPNSNTYNNSAAACTTQDETIDILSPSNNLYTNNIQPLQNKAYDSPHNSDDSPCHTDDALFYHYVLTNSPESNKEDVLPVLEMLVFRAESMNRIEDSLIYKRDSDLFVYNCDGRGNSHYSEFIYTRMNETCKVDWVRHLSVENMCEQGHWNPLSIFGSAPPAVCTPFLFPPMLYNQISASDRLKHPAIRYERLECDWRRKSGKTNFILSQEDSKLAHKVFSLLEQHHKQRNTYTQWLTHLSKPIEPSEWPKIKQRLVFIWSHEEEMDLNWKHDLLSSNEIKWLTHIMQWNVNKKDQVAIKQPCFCPAPNPNTTWGWNDPRHILQNKSKNRLSEAFGPNLSIFRHKNSFISPNLRQKRLSTLYYNFRSPYKPY